MLWQELHTGRTLVSRNFSTQKFWRDEQAHSRIPSPSAGAAERADQTSEPKASLIEHGCILRRKGRPLRKDADELTMLRNECTELCRPKYCETFYPELEGGESQISGNRALQEEISDHCIALHSGSLPQRLLRLEKAKA